MFFFSTLFFPHDIIDSSKHVVPNCDGKKHLRFKDVSIECRVALAIAQVLGLNPTKKHKKPLENLKRCFTNITQPPHVALYQIQLPGQKSDKTRSFHSHRFFRKSLRGDWFRKGRWSRRSRWENECRRFLIRGRLKYYLFYFVMRWDQVFEGTKMLACTNANGFTRIPNDKCLARS